MPEQLDLFTEDRSYYLDSINGCMSKIYDLNRDLINGRDDKETYEDLVNEIDKVGECVKEYLRNESFSSYMWDVSGSTTDIIDRAIDQFSRILFSNGDVRYSLWQVHLMLGTAQLRIEDELIKINHNCRPKKMEAVNE